MCTSHFLQKIIIFSPSSPHISNLLTNPVHKRIFILKLRCNPLVTNRLNDYHYNKQEPTNTVNPEFLGSFVLFKLYNRIQNLYSTNSPLVPTTTTCQGTILPLCTSAFFTAFSIPPQHGTSILTTFTLLMSLFLKISVSFSE